MITCNKCKISKDESEFYPRNKVCKECTKTRVAEYVKTNVGMAVKKAAAKKHAQTEKGRKTQKKADAKYKSNEKNRKKIRAKDAIKRAIKSGLIKKMPCEICGDNGVAHHDDYDKPLDVRWLCQLHHKRWHMENGEGKNTYA